MAKKGVIYDLDNTIYSVYEIGHDLFAPLFTLIELNGNHTAEMDSIKKDIMRKPFQVVAATYNFDDDLTQKGLHLLKSITYSGSIVPFSDYSAIKKFNAQRFLVTTGFLHFQQMKINKMGIEKDFAEIHIVDPDTTTKTKKEVFEDIMQRHHYNKEDLLVVGDDLQSEIKAAQALGIDTVLYDKFDFHTDIDNMPRISNFAELGAFLD